MAIMAAMLATMLHPSPIHHACYPPAMAPHGTPPYHASVRHACHRSQRSSCHAQALEPHGTLHGRKDNISDPVYSSCICYKVAKRAPTVRHKIWHTCGTPSTQKKSKKTNAQGENPVATRKTLVAITRCLRATPTDVMQPLLSLSFSFTRSYVLYAEAGPCFQSPATSSSACGGGCGCRARSSTWNWMYA